MTRAAPTLRHIELTAGESLQVAGCTITLVRKSGQRARLSVSAAPGLQIVHPIPRAHECAPPVKEEPHHGQHPL